MTNVGRRLFSPLFAISLACGVFLSLGAQKTTISAQAAVQTGWTRVTAVSEITSGGTFIIGYEATVDSDVIVPLRSDGAAATISATGILYSGTTAGSSTAGTIDMASIATTTPYELVISSSSTTSGAVNIAMASGYFIGNSGSKNTAKLYTAAGLNTDYTPTILSGKFRFTSPTSVSTTYYALQYNKNSSQERYCNYGGTQQDLTLYKKAASSLPSVTITTSNQGINIGGSYQYLATTSNAGSATVVWSIAPTSIATIDSASGLVTGVSIGQATVTATITVESTPYTATKLVYVNGDATITEAFNLASALTTPSSNTNYRVTIVGSSTITSVLTTGMVITDGVSSITVYGGTNWRTTNLPQSIVGGHFFLSGSLQNYQGTTPEITNPTIISYTDAVEELATSILVGDTEGQCTTRFAEYKTTVLGFTTDELNKFQTSTATNIADARARYVAWAANLNEAPYVAGSASVSVIAPATADSGSFILIISILGVTALAGFFLMSRKKEEQA